MALSKGLKSLYSETLLDPKRQGVAIVTLIILAVIALSDTAATKRGLATDPNAAIKENELTLGGEEGGIAPGAAGVATETASVNSPGARRTRGSPGGSGGPSGGSTGVSATEVKVGIAYNEDPGTANAAAGFAGIGQVNQKRGWDAMLAEIGRNAAFGRKVVPVYYSFTTDQVLSKGAEQLSAEMCQRWTRDNRVFIAYAGSGIESLSACLTKAGVAQLGGGAGFSYDKTFTDYPYLVEHNSSALDRMAEDQVNQLVAHGYFTKCKNHASTSPCVDGKPRIGLIRYNQPSHKAAAKRMKETLAKHGYALCDGCEFEVSYSNDDLAAQLDDATEVNNAINNCRLTHKAQGSKSAGAPDGPCTHMLFLGSIAGVRITLFYIQRAEDQGYRARLGFNRMDAPAAVRDFFRNNGQPNYLNQFTNSILVSYAPGDFSIEPPAFKDCVKLFQDAGETFTGSEASNKFAQIPAYCDTAWYHIAAFKAAGPSLDINAWLKGVATAGQVKSAGTFLMRTTANRRDGAGAVRVGDYDIGGSCVCWKDVSGQIEV